MLPLTWYERTPPAGIFALLLPGGGYPRIPVVLGTSIWVAMPAMVYRMATRRPGEDGELRLRRGLVTVFLLLLLAMAGGCGDAARQQTPVTPSSPEPRSFSMGWAPTPPQPTVESLIETANAMAPVSEMAIVQRPVPWARLFAGETLASLVAGEVSLAQFLRGLNLEIVWLVDPLDGLNRTRETPELVAAGRSILEPAIRSLHEQWVLEIARQIQPLYLGLGSEINTLGAHGDPTLYAELVNLVNTLTPQIHMIDPAIRVFVSFQMEDAWQLPPFPPSSVDHFTLISDFQIDALGLSSYPVFTFNIPADMPDTYFARFAAATTLPLILVEGGWSSGSGPGFQGTLQEQVQFFSRFEQFLDGVQADLWVMLLFADIDVAALAAAAGLSPEDAATLANFAEMGIVDQTLTPKPAFTEWQRIFARPRQPAIP